MTVGTESRQQPVSGVGGRNTAMSENEAEQLWRRGRRDVIISAVGDFSVSRPCFIKWSNGGSAGLCVRRAGRCLLIRDEER